MMRKTSGSTQIYNLLRSFNEIDNFEKLEKIVEMYKDDFDEFSLEAQLKLLPSISGNAGYRVGRIDIADA